MARSFKTEIEVNELYELQVSVPYKAHSQRDGNYTEHKKETHTFLAFDDAVEWVKENPSAKIESFVHMENKINALKFWARS